jgi:EF hand
MKKSTLFIVILFCLTIALPASAQAPAGGAPQGAAPGGTTAKINLDKSELYKAIDKNKDGCMSYEEWHAVGMPDSSYNMLAKDGCVTPKIMEDNGDPSTDLDGNGDGKITLEEFLAFDKKMAPQAGGQGGAPQGAPPAQGTPDK